MKEKKSLEELISFEQEAADHRYSLGYWLGNPREWLWAKYYKSQPLSKSSQVALLSIVTLFLVGATIYLAIEFPRTLLIIIVTLIAALLMMGIGMILIHVIIDIQKRASAKPPNETKSNGT